MPADSKKILLVINVDWFFLSHRLGLAREAQRRGYDVHIACADTGEGNTIRSYGFTYHPIPLSRKGTMLLEELSTIRRLYRLYRDLRPNLVHHVTIKPVIYGSIAALAYPHLGVVNAVTGLGYNFSEGQSSGPLTTLIRQLYRLAFLHPGQVTIFQNEDDLARFSGSGLIRSENAVVIKGSGVDVKQFSPADSEPKEQVVLLAARMIEHKGIFEFAEAATFLKQNHPGVKFILAGKTDPGNPASISADRLRALSARNNVEWVGFIPDMADYLKKVSVVVLPTTYPEGVPKVLIEAAAMGIPIVASDVPGCRDIVADGENGFLVPVKNPALLAEKIDDLLSNPGKRSLFGRRGRSRVLREFSQEIVLSKTLRVYEKMLHPATGSR